jgi:hypothetical protein
MNPFEMVVLIVAIVVLGKVFAERARSRRGRPEVDAENERLRQEMAGLKDRIATLERLATDKRQLLADEIDALGRDR